MEAAQSVLVAVFRLGIGNGLPLHVARLIRAACTKWGYVVNNIAWAWQAVLPGGWARLRLHESMTRGSSAGLLCISRAGREGQQSEH